MFVRHLMFHRKDLKFQSGSESKSFLGKPDIYTVIALYCAENDTDKYLQRGNCFAIVSFLSDPSSIIFNSGLVSDGNKQTSFKELSVNITSVVFFFRYFFACFWSMLS